MTKQINHMRDTETLEVVTYGLPGFVFERSGKMSRRDAHPAGQFSRNQILTVMEMEFLESLLDEGTHFIATVTRK